MAIGIVVLANVFIFTVHNTSQYSGVNGTAGTSWTSAEIALWGLISLIGIAGMIYGVMSVFGMG